MNKKTECYSPASQHALEQFVLPARLDRLEQVLACRSRSLTIVLDRIHHGHNISAVMRSADAFGIQDIHLVGDQFEFSKEISLGAERWLTLSRYASAGEAVQKLHAEGYSIVVLESAELCAKLGRASIPVFQLPFQQKLALVFGNEHEGVSPTFRENADFFAHIPMFGFVESFNISVAAAITLFCSTFQRAEGIRQVAPLAESEAAALHAEWLQKTVRNSALILQDLEERAKLVASEDSEADR